MKQTKKRGNRKQKLGQEIETASKKTLTQPNDKEALYLIAQNSLLALNIDGYRQLLVKTSTGITSFILTLFILMFMDDIPTFLDNLWEDIDALLEFFHPDTEHGQPIFLVVTWTILLIYSIIRTSSSLSENISKFYFDKQITGLINKKYDMATLNKENLAADRELIQKYNDRWINKNLHKASFLSLLTLSTISLQLGGSKTDSTNLSFSTFTIKLSFIAACITLIPMFAKELYHQISRDKVSKIVDNLFIQLEEQYGFSYSEFILMESRDNDDDKAEDVNRYFSHTHKGALFTITFPTRHTQKNKVKRFQANIIIPLLDEILKERLGFKIHISTRKEMVIESPIKLTAKQADAAIEAFDELKEQMEEQYKHTYNKLRKLNRKLQKLDKDFIYIDEYRWKPDIRHRKNKLLIKFTLETKYSKNANEKIMNYLKEHPNNKVKKYNGEITIDDFSHFKLGKFKAEEIELYPMITPTTKHISKGQPQHVISNNKTPINTSRRKKKKTRGHALNPKILHDTQFSYHFFYRKNKGKKACEDQSSNFPAIKEAQEDDDIAEYIIIYQDGKEERKSTHKNLIAIEGKTLGIFSLKGKRRGDGERYLDSFHRGYAKTQYGTPGRKKLIFKNKHEKHIIDELKKKGAQGEYRPGGLFQKVELIKARDSKNNIIETDLNQVVIYDRRVKHRN